MDYEKVHYLTTRYFNKYTNFFSGSYNRVSWVKEVTYWVLFEKAHANKPTTRDIYLIVTNLNK